MKTFLPGSTVAEEGAAVTTWGGGSRVQGALTSSGMPRISAKQSLHCCSLNQVLWAASNTCKSHTLPVSCCHTPAEAVIALHFPMPLNTQAPQQGEGTAYAES